MALKFKRNKANSDSAGARKQKLVASSDPKSPISEQYRTIRTNILFSSVDQSLQTLLVTSTNPGEGKSTTASNLAVVFANQGKKVLLVDADMRKPTVHYAFGVPNTLGLTNVLTKQASLLQASSSTEIENLFVLTSGPIPPNPAELLGSEAMKKLMETARQEFDYILFDTPPVLAVTDPQVLANECDGTILVVNSGKTQIENAQKAKELLETGRSKVLGVVLNNYTANDSGYYYYYAHKE